MGWRAREAQGGCCCLSLPKRFVGARDTRGQQAVLDIHNSVEVGRTVRRTTGAGSDVHRRHRPRSGRVVVCNLDRRKVATVAKLGHNLVELCSVGLRNENHLWGGFELVQMESSIVYQ